MCDGVQGCVVNHISGKEWGCREVPCLPGAEPGGRQMSHNLKRRDDACVIAVAATRRLVNANVYNRSVPPPHPSARVHPCLSTPNELLHNAYRTSAHRASCREWQSAAGAR